MIVTNVANGEKKVVYFHNRTPYLMTNIEKTPYYVLDTVVTDQIEGYKYSYWTIEDIIYSGYYTNTLESIKEKKGCEQLRLF